MTLKQLTYFLQLADCKSFTVASNELFICQSALSKTIKQMEFELGVKLIDRVSKPFQLTPEGRVLYERGKVALHIINEQLECLSDCVGVNYGKIRVGVPPVISTVYFANILHLFIQKHPSIELEILEYGANTVLENVENGNIDVGVVILPISTANLNVVPVFKSENVLVVSKKHRLANYDTVPFRELKGEKMVTLNESYMLYDRTEQLCHKAGFEPKFTIKSSQWDFLMALISLNLGVGILPKPIVEKANLDYVKLISLTEPEFPWDIAFITRKDKYISNPIRIFLQFVLENRNLVK